MSAATPRRTFLKSLIAGTLVLGFDPVHRTWVTSGQAVSTLVGLPPLDGVLVTDVVSRLGAADDFGHIVHREPVAVLKPGSVDDIVRMVRFARAHDMQVAAQGQRHSTYGQGQVAMGIVVDMRTLDTIYTIGTDRVDVDAGALWSSVLRATLTHELTPPVLTDYIELSVG